MTKLDFVRQLHEMGISVIPLHHRSKIPDTSLTNGTWEQFQTEPNTEYQVYQWLASDWLNYGVVAGWNDLAFLDFDDWAVFELWKDYYTVHLRKPMPFIVLTSRGVHVYIQLHGHGANERRYGCDVKRHGYVVGPGCVHQNGTEYMPVGKLHLAEACLDEILPADLFPHVVSENCHSHKLFDVQLHTPNTEYCSDPFAEASMVNDVDLITKVKQSVRIESLFPGAERSSVDGRWLKAICLFHDDTRPSAWIDTRRQIYGCNVCGMKPMDVINLWSKMHNISNSDAVVALAREAGIWR